MSLWKKNNNEIELVKYWELERITGLKKHGISYKDKDSITHIIKELILEEGLEMKDIEGIIGTPDLDTISDYNSLEELPNHSYHSISHLFSGLMIDSDIFYQEKIIGISVDGGSDDVVDFNANSKRIFTSCYAKAGNIEYFYASSPAPLWSFARIRYNLRQGTLMALASAANSEVLFDINPFYDIYSNNDIFHSHKWFEELAYKIESLTEKDSGILFNGFDHRFSERDNKISMLMKVIQKLSNDIMERNIDMIVKACNIDTKNTYLSVTGGFALNCVTNTHLMNKYGFIQFLAPPCVNDAGQSMGIALYYFYKKIGRLNFKLGNAFKGNRYNNLKYIIKNSEFAHYVKDAYEFNYKTLIEDIKQDVIVWFWGESEIGPRALGNRSILGDPRVERTKERLNKIKQRQWRRPVAPIILEEELDDWFEFGYKSKFMLHAAIVKEEKREFVPAIVHLDGSARLQTVNKENDSVLYEIIRKFDIDTGVPVLCNTSLNDCGEPIIERIEEALNFAIRKKIRIAYINGIRIEIVNNVKFHEEGPHERPFYKEFQIDESERVKLIARLNPYSVPSHIITNYWRLSELRNGFDLKSEKEVKYLLKIITRMNQHYNILNECSD